MRRTLKTNRVGAVQIASNMYIKQKYGTVFLYSYETPVAGEDHNGKFRTDKHYSSTTSRTYQQMVRRKNCWKNYPSGRNLSEGGNCKLYVKNACHFGQFAV